MGAFVRLFDLITQPVGELRTLLGAYMSKFESNEPVLPFLGPVHPE
jgi:hypothetical protein